MIMKIDLKTTVERINIILNSIQPVKNNKNVSSFKEYKGIIFEFKNDDLIEIYLKKVENEKTFLIMLKNVILTNFPSTKEEIEEMIFKAISEGDVSCIKPNKKEFIKLSDLINLYNNFILDSYVIESSFKNKLHNYLERFLFIVFIGSTLIYLFNNNNNFLIFILGITFSLLIVLLVYYINAIVKTNNLYLEAGSVNFECGFCEFYGITTKSFRAQKEFFKSLKNNHSLKSTSEKEILFLPLFLEKKKL